MLKTLYDTKEEIPEGFGTLYTEKNGKWELTGVTGVKTQADIDRVTEALRKEKADHKVVKDALKGYEGVDVEVYHSQATELEETKAQLDAIKKDGTIDEAKLEPIIQARVKQMVAPVERDKTVLQKQLEAAKAATAAKDAETVELRQTIVSGDIARAIRDAAVIAKVLPSAIGDVAMRGQTVFERTEDGRIITKDNSGAVAGLTPTEWLKDEIEKSPHWWPPSVGGGSGPLGKSGGGAYHGANNPFSKAGWNVTKQGLLVKADPAKAADIAALVGSKIGDTKPQAV
jgi:hypothetical protein